MKEPRIPEMSVNNPSALKLHALAKEDYTEYWVNGHNSVNGIFNHYTANINNNINTFCIYTPQHVVIAISIIAYLLHNVCMLVCESVCIVCVCV